MGFNHLGTICIFVSDQDRAKAFYLHKLGFELHSDEPLYPNASARWLAVAPPGGQTEIILYQLDDNWRHYEGVLGKSQALTLDVTNLVGLTAELKARGVKFTQEPAAQPWGIFATLEDSEGNQLLLVEQPHSMT